MWDFDVKFYCITIAFKRFEIKLHKSAEYVKDNQKFY